jgi:effector-binding domain-containing protein
LIFKQFSNKENIMVWLYILIAVLAAAVIYLLTLPKDYQVQRSITIKRPVAEVFEQVQDFRLWDAWSPWMLHDRASPSTIERPIEVGGSSAWDSKKIGSGRTTHTSIVANESIVQKLEFFKPFKSISSVDWCFAEHNGETTVTWAMNASMPLPMRPMIPMISRMIGLDFELGLGLMRGILDPSSEYPKLDFEGVQQITAQTCTVTRYEGLLGKEHMSPAMGSAESGYSALYAAAQDRITGGAMAAYHKVSMRKQTTVCDFGFPVSSIAAGETALNIATGPCFQVRYQGSYEFLGSAWNAAMGQMKMQKLKLNTLRPSLEIYTNSPDQVGHSNELVTLLQIPIKG